MEGSLQVKNGIYQVVIPYKDEFGKSKRKWISTGIEAKAGNKRKANEIKKQLVRDFEDNLIDVNTKINKAQEESLADYLKSWLDSRKPFIEGNTLEGYEIIINVMNRHFKDLKLKDVKPYHIQDYYNKMFNEGKKGVTVQHHHVILKKAFGDAVKLEKIDKDPMESIARPKKDKYQAEFYNKEELNQLFEFVKGDALELIIHITAYYGLRRSEVLGLKWDSIDFQNKMIKINHKVVEIKRKLVVRNKMKNETSNRTLPLIPHIEQLLLKEKEKQSINKKLCGDRYNYNYTDFVCVNSLGDLIKPGFVTQHFELIMSKVNMKKIRFHDLRHSCASLMLANGTQMKQIQEWLGHSTFNTTADIYAHLDYSSKIASARTIQNAFKEEKEKSEQELMLEIERLQEELEAKKKEMEKQKKKKDFEM